MQKFKDLKEQYSVSAPVQNGNGGEVIIVNYNGLSPKKIDHITEMSFYKAWPYFTSAKIENDEYNENDYAQNSVHHFNDQIML